MLRAEELMIGDWVIVYEKAMPVKARVDGVYGNNAFVLGHPRTVENGFVEPIPITPEILEKNGFERGSDNLFSYGRGMYVMMWSKEHYSVGQIFGNWSAFVEFAEIRFVHELQHCLKLCGIDKTIEL